MALPRPQNELKLLLCVLLACLACVPPANAQGRRGPPPPAELTGPATTVPMPAEVLAAKADATPYDSSMSRPGGPRIVGGFAAGSTDFRFMAALVARTRPGYARNDFTQQFCGAALIGSSTSVWVLTAAHCVSGQSTSAFDVLVNSSRLDNTGTRYQVSSINVHPSFSWNTFRNDVALVKLKTAPPSTIPRVELGFVPAVGTPLTVIGWGTLSESGSRPIDLQRVDVNVVDKTVCNSASSYKGKVLSSMFCAGPLTGGKDSCQGDSGGPILRPKTGGVGFRTVGAVSWGTGCARANYPGVYTDLGSVSSFISSKSGINVLA